MHNHGVNSLNGTKLGTTEAQFLADGTTPNPQRTTLQYLLSQQAQTPYLTGIVGKYLNRWGTADKNLDSCNDPAPSTKPPFFEKFWVFEQSYSPFCVNENGNEKWLWRYSTDYVAKKAREFISTAESDDQRPWFLYVAPFAPHMPFIPRADHADDRPPPFSPSSSFFEQDRTDKPVFYQRGLVPGGFEGDQDSTLRDRSSQLLSLKAVDEMVDSIMNELVLRGENQDTLAIFTSDNGYMSGGARKGRQEPALPRVGARTVLHARPRRNAGCRSAPGGEHRHRSDRAGRCVRDRPSGIDGRPVPPQPEQEAQRLLTEHWQLGGSTYYMHWASLRTPTFH